MKSFIIHLGSGLYLDGIEGTGSQDSPEYWQTTDNRKTAWRFGFDAAYRRLVQVKKAFPLAEVEAV